MACSHVQSPTKVEFGQGHRRAVTPRWTADGILHLHPTLSREKASGRMGGAAGAYLISISDTGIIAGVAVGTLEDTEGQVLYFSSGSLTAAAGNAATAMALKVIQPTDPGCVAPSDHGKWWLDTTTTTDVYKVCQVTSGTLGWVTHP